MISDVLLLSVGVAAGYLLAKVLREPSTCCQRVAAGVRAEVELQLGPKAAAIGDLLGYDWTPGALDLFGVVP